MNKNFFVIISFLIALALVGVTGGFVLSIYGFSALSVVFYVISGVLIVAVISFVLIRYLKIKGKKDR